jgi:hypothetical protein
LIPKLKKNQFFKGAKLDGWDLHTGSTINYRESIGKIVKPKNFKDLLDYKLCSDEVIHACKNLLDIFRYANLPCSLYIVEGNPVTADNDKSGFTELKVVEEIPESSFDEIFPFKYNEIFKNPLDPKKITPPAIDADVLKILKRWDSVRGSVWDSVRGSVWDSVRDSVRGSVWDSVRDSVRDSVWDSVWDSVRGSVWDSVWDSVRGSVWDSVRDSEYAYLGTLFPNVKLWNFPTKDGIKKVKKYPYNDAVELLKLGLVPAYNSYHKVWYLLSGPEMKIVWEGKL